jgi:hypothetical protein
MDKKQILQTLEECVIFISEEYQEDPDLAETNIYFFLHAFGSYLNLNEARSILLDVQHCANQILWNNFT